MSILIDKKSRVLVQGITGRDGSFHTSKMLEYGTNIVAGVTPGKGGNKVENVEVFNTVFEAAEKTNADTSIIFVPAPCVYDAVIEAIDAGIELIVIITEGVPVHDMARIMTYIEGKSTRIIGPNCPGLISPGKAKVGILPSSIFKQGKIGVISRSGTLTYEIVSHITKSGLGESTCIGIGGDPIIGSNFISILKEFNNDTETEAVVLIGEIGGSAEEDAASYIKQEFKKPVVSFIAGRTAPEGKRMGHAGAIISGTSGRAEDKVRHLENAGIPVASEPAEIVNLLMEKLK